MKSDYIKLICYKPTYFESGNNLIKIEQDEICYLVLEGDNGISDDSGEYLAHYYCIYYNNIYCHNYGHWEENFITAVELRSKRIKLLLK